MNKETKLFAVIFIVLLVSVFSCWLLGQQQEPEFEQQTVKECPNLVDTIITVTMTGHGLDWDNKTIVDYEAVATHTETVCNSYKTYLPLIIKNAK